METKLPTEAGKPPAMTCTRLTIWSLCAAFLQILGLCLFVLGFFPVKPTLTGFSGPSYYFPMGSDSAEQHFNVSSMSPDELKSLYRDLSQIPHPYRRLIFMVVDGLPAEFVLGINGQPPPAAMRDAMPYTQYLLENGMAIGYHAKASPPTVTMPRLKAMMSGAVGGFLDVASNFNTQALLDDNLLAQFFRIGWKMVMLGDDTWLKLFPNLFVRHDGVNSFFVKDTVVVDRNVSRHLSTELNQDDWNLLILHYLGLDHVGHIGGRGSILMASKLREMDEVIKMIHLNNILNHDDVQGPTLLVVVSDHGMTDDGNHGGSSPEETDSLALFVGPTFKVPAYTSATDNTVSQVDITPTLALLFGVPIPVNNVGVVITESLDCFTNHEKLRALELNSWQLLRLLQAQFSGSSCLNSISDGHDDHYKCATCYGMVKERLCCLYSKAAAFHKALMSQNISRSSDRYQYDRTVSAYYDFLNSASEWLSHRVTDKPIGQLAVGILAMLLSCIVFLSLLFHLRTEWIQERQWFMDLHISILGWSVDEIFLVIAIIILFLSMGSSSMVEEEQYIWHFFASTFYLLLLRRSIKGIPTGLQKLLCKGQKRSYFNIFCISVLLIAGRIIRGWHQGGVNWTYLPDISKWLEHSGSNYVKSAQLCSLILIMSWSLLAFSSSMSKRNFILLVKFSFFCSGLLVLQHLLKYQDNMLVESSYGATLVAQVIYAVLGVFSLGTVLATPWLTFDLILDNGSSSDSKLSACLSVDVQTCHASAFVRNSSYLSGQAYVFSWCLLQLLLQRPINAAPVVLLLLQVWVIVMYFCNEGLVRKPWVEVVALYFIGMTCHFGLGNTNTLATIDVAGAFIGMSSYSTFLSGLLMLSITYASPLLVLLSMATYVSMEHTGSHSSLQNGDGGHLLKRMIGIPCLTPLCVNSILLTAYSVVLLQMRNHLFIWSVFSPKYLYLCGTTVCVYVGITILVVTENYIWSVYCLRIKIRVPSKNDLQKDFQ